MVLAIEDFTNVKSDKFMEIIDVGLFEEYYSAFGGADIDGGLPLKILSDKGVDTTPNFKVKTTDLSYGYKNFKGNDDDTITFKVDVIIKSDDKWGYMFKRNPLDYEGFGYHNRMRISRWLDMWMKNMTPLYVVSDAVDVPDGTYLITKNSSRKQTYRDYTIWTLEFTTFKNLELYRYENDNAIVQSAIEALTPKTSSSSSSSSNSTSGKSLKDCKASDIKYSTSKVVTECNKLVQKKLYELGYLCCPDTNIDGWYGTVTLNAVKQFQKDQNNKGHNLKVDGIVGEVTLPILAGA